MKYISLLVFTAALVWTWNIVHDSSAISFETHSGIQEKMAEFINETVKTKRPSATDIKIEKIWTEVLAGNRVHTFFIYSFTESSESGPVRSEIKGEGTLERQPDDGSGMDRWTLTQIRTTSDAVQFDQATLVTGNPSGTVEEESSEKTSEGHSEVTPPPPTPEVKAEEHR